MGPADAVAEDLASSRPGSSPESPANPRGTAPPRPVAARPAIAEAPPGLVMPRPLGAVPATPDGSGRRSDSFPGCPIVAARLRTLRCLASAVLGVCLIPTERVVRPGSGRSGPRLQPPGSHHESPTA